MIPLLTINLILRLFLADSEISLIDIFLQSCCSHHRADGIVDPCDLRRPLPGHLGALDAALLNCLHAGSHLTHEAFVELAFGNGRFGVASLQDAVISVAQRLLVIGEQHAVAKNGITA